MKFPSAACGERKRDQHHHRAASDKRWHNAAAASPSLVSVRHAMSLQRCANALRALRCDGSGGGPVLSPGPHRPQRRSRTSIVPQRERQEEPTDHTIWCINRFPRMGAKPTPSGSALSEITRRMPMLARSSSLAGMSPDLLFASFKKSLKLSLRPNTIP